MNSQMMSIEDIKLNPNNPRIIKDHKFKKLVKSIKEFPQMLEIRPIVVNEDMIVLGGNMRLRACQEANLTEVPVIIAKSLTPEQEKEFIIKDNVAFGEWDFEILANEWDVNQLAEWSLDIPIWNEQVNDTTQETNPKGSDDNYSVFELIMLHENKLSLLETLNKVKQNYMFEKQEEALMEIIRIYNQQ